MVMKTTRARLLRKGRTLQVINVLYDTLEVVISLIAGFAANSSALIGWGLDSIVEVIGAATLGWRLHGEIEGINRESIERRRKITLYVISASFLLVSIFITYDSISKIINKEVVEWSTMGFIILLVSLVVNPLFIYYKYRFGRKLKSDELIADAKDTFICLYQTIVVLAGLLLVNWLGWWWADPIAALLIVPYALKESWETFRKVKLDSALVE